MTEKKAETPVQNAPSPSETRQRIIDWRDNRFMDTGELVLSVEQRQAIDELLYFLWTPELENELAVKIKPSPTPETPVPSDASSESLIRELVTSVREAKRLIDKHDTGGWGDSWQDSADALLSRPELAPYRSGK